MYSTNISSVTLSVLGFSNRAPPFTNNIRFVCTSSSVSFLPRTGKLTRYSRLGNTSSVSSALAEYTKPGCKRPCFTRRVDRPRNTSKTQGERPGRVVSAFFRAFRRPFKRALRWFICSAKISRRAPTRPYDCTS